MDSISANDMELVDNSKNDGHGGREVCKYFDCKICKISVSIGIDEENVDPNVELSDVCKNCKSRQKFRSSLPDDIHESVLPKPTQNISMNAEEEEISKIEQDAGMLSPLTTISKSNNSGGSSGGDSAREEENTNFNDEIFSVGVTRILTLGNTSLHIFVKLSYPYVFPCDRTNGSVLYSFQTSTSLIGSMCISSALG